MADKENQDGGTKGSDRTPINEGYVPVEKGWQPHVQGGYRPTTSEAGNPPTGGGGGKEPEKSADKE